MSDNPAADRTPKSYVSVTIGDDEYRHLPVNSVRAQLQWSKTARAQGWDREDNLLAGLFLAWWVGKQRELWSLSWEEFSGSDDIYVDEDTAPTPDVEDEADPTQSATSAE